MIGAQIVNQAQSIVSRSVDPIKSGLISICQFHAGSADNVIPQTATLRGTARSLLPEVRDTLENRLRQIVEGTAKAYGAQGDAHLQPPLSGDQQPRARRPSLRPRSRARSSARERVDANTPPLMGGEDFSFMLEARPGAFIFIGNGDSAGLHHPAYDFNDEVIPVGMSVLGAAGRDRDAGVARASKRSVPRRRATSAARPTARSRISGLASKGDRCARSSAVATV